MPLNDGSESGSQIDRSSVCACKCAPGVFSPISALPLATNLNSAILGFLHLHCIRPVASVGYRKHAREYLLIRVALQIRPHLWIEASSGLNITYRSAAAQ